MKCNGLEDLFYGRIPRDWPAAPSVCPMAVKSCFLFYWLLFSKNTEQNGGNGFETVINEGLGEGNLNQIQKYIAYKCS